MPEEAIRTQGLTKRFRNIVAVDHLDLTVFKGEIFGLVGPDGAGKTTTIRMLASIMVPTEGKAFVGGYDVVAQAEEVKKIIGYMPQHFALYGDLSVLENLNFFADLFEVPRRERQERIERLLHFARLREFRSRRAAHLSGGMQKKLALACALIHHPQVLLLDEPTTGVDPVSRREFWDLITELHLQGTTILISTPYMDEAERCSRVGLMYRGKLIICDEPARVKAMVQGELLEVRPSDMQKARQVLSGAEGVLEVQTYGDLLHIFVDDAVRRLEEVRRVLEAGGIKVYGIRKTRPKMEDAFISLIGRMGERI
ncbi:MAG TPA: ABC transporter ATP-binding protein [Chloroflexi bacterium]|nr:ABC transporter ATP-binding protein [Chloroflexota bacterium]